MTFVHYDGPETPAPADKEVFDAAVRQAIRQMKTDGSKSVTISHVCAVNRWKRSNSTSRHIMLVFSELGMVKVTNYVYTMPEVC